MVSPRNPHDPPQGFVADAPGKVDSVAWLDGGRRIGVATWDQVALEYDAPATPGDPIGEGTRARRGIRFASTPDARTTAFGPWRPVATLRSAAGADRELGPQTEGVSSNVEYFFGVALSPDGQRLATRCSNSSLAMWDVSTGKQTSFLQDAGQHGPIAFSPDGKLLAAARGSEVALLDAADLTRAPLQTFGCKDGVVALAWRTGTPAYLATGGPDRTIRLWQQGRADPVALLPGHGDVIQALAWSRDGSLLASGSADRSVRLWRVDMLTADLGDLRTLLRDVKRWTWMEVKGTQLVTTKPR
jgi:WD40 repeat protein